MLPKSNQNPNVTIGDVFQRKRTLDRTMPYSFSDFGKLPHYNQNADKGRHLLDWLPSCPPCTNGGIGILRVSWKSFMQMISPE